MRSQKVTSGFTRAPHRSLFYGLGLTEEEINLPKIGIVNSFNEIVPGHKHLKEISEAVKRGVLLKGGVPLEFNTIAVCDGIAMNHEGMNNSLPTREIIADSIEASAIAMPFDALVFIPNCDKVIPGMLMAAARLNLPSIFISGGPMLAGKFKNKRIALSDMFEYVGKYAVGEMDDEELKEAEQNACRTCGSCAGMYTANTMNCLLEGLGVSLSGNGTIPAVFSERIRLAKETGFKIMDLLNENIKFKDILNENALINAVTLDMALGGSTNTTLHIPALAYESGIKFDLENFDAISFRTKQIVKLSPGGKYFIEDLNEAGGIKAVLNILYKNELLIDNITVTGKTIFEIASSGKVLDTDIIRDFRTAYLETGGIAILKGNIAKDGAVVKAGAVEKRMQIHSGPAKVFYSEEEATEAILTGCIERGDIIVILYEGPKGGPGMREMLSPTGALVGMDLDKYCALITDGRFSGGSRGAAIGHISPEAMAGGEIAIIETGDIIEINIPDKTINLKVSEEEIKKRLNRLILKEKKVTNRMLLKYRKLVSSASEGAVTT